MERAIAIVINSTFGILAILAAVLFHRRSKQTVYLSRLMPVVAALCFFISAAILQLGILSFAGWEIVCFMVFAVGAILLLKFCRWRIQYTANQITVRRVISSKDIALDDVTGVKEYPQGGVIYLSDGKKLRVDALSVGWEELLGHLDHSYKRKKHTQLPRIPEQLFHGHLRNPAEYIVVLAAAGLFFAGGVIYFAVTSWPTYMAVPENLAEIIPAQWSVTEEDNTTGITCPDVEGIYFINDETIRDSDLKNRIRSAKEISFTIDEKDLLKTDRRGKYFRIWELKADGRTVVSENETKTAMRKEFYVSLSIPTVILLLYIGFLVMFCHVISNAERYPQLARQLVKEEYLIMHEERSKPKAFIHRDESQCSDETFYLLNIARFRQDEKIRENINESTD